MYTFPQTFVTLICTLLRSSSWAASKAAKQNTETRIGSLRTIVLIFM